MQNFRLLSGLLVVSLVGCANLHTVGRSTSLPRDGVAVHLDASQRVVLTRSGPAPESGAPQGALDQKHDRTVMLACAEPSPDAMQAYASSLGVGFAMPTKESVSIAQALSASAGSIGLRTQSITLMRDALYRICELYFNGAISKRATVQLLERSQDLSLGILAIEQLTGAVTAQQVAINTSSAATAAAAINDTQKELDKAKADEAGKKTAVDSAQTTLNTQKTDVAAKTDVALAAKEKAKKTQTQIDMLDAKLIEARKAQVTAKTARDASATEIEEGEGALKSLSAAEKRQHGVVKRAELAAADWQKKLDAANAAKPPAPNDIKRATEGKQKADDAVQRAADELKDRQEAVATADKSLRQEKSATKKLDADVAKSDKDVATITGQLKKLHADPQQVEADKAVAALAAATAALKVKQTAFDNATAAYELAQANTKEIEKLGVTATAAASASNNSNAQFSAASARYGVSKDTVDALTKATVEIVQTVVNKGHLTDSCAILLMTWDTLSKDDRSHLKEIMPLCEKAIDATLAVYKASGGISAEESLISNCTSMLTGWPTLKDVDKAAMEPLLVPCQQAIYASISVYKLKAAAQTDAAARTKDEIAIGATPDPKATKKLDTKKRADRGPAAAAPQKL